MQLQNPIGFAASDFIELGLAAILVLSAILWRRLIAPVAQRVAERAIWCMIGLAVLPVAIRLALLPWHPAPAPDVYDEFRHLLVADTLRHFRFANPPHALPQFFETFFVLQRPTYSSIYPIGQGVALALGWSIFGIPWAGVLVSMAALCSLCYWMLRGWTSPGWALLGGVLTVCEFGPLNPWTNSYWGGAFAAAAGCLVFGALPRLRRQYRARDAVLLGLGLALHLLTRPYESIFLVLSVLLFWLPDWRRALRPLMIAAVVVLPAVGLTLLQNKAVTHSWTTLPYSLSQYQYGVPAPLTFQASVTPHRQLTREQALDYQMQRAFRASETETLRSYAQRLWYRVRFYRFYFYPPLYLALVAFIVCIRDYRSLWIALTAILFALGVNFFPAFQTHYLGGIVCLFVLMSVMGLERIGKWSGGDTAVRVIVCLCVAQFLFLDRRDFPDRRADVNRELAATQGKVLVFVRYWPNHIFQNEWVYNSADIDGQRVVMARDLGEPEDEKLRRYYPDRVYWLLEPDAQPPRLTPYKAEQPPAAVPKPEQPQKEIIPGLKLEQVR